MGNVPESFSTLHELDLREQRGRIWGRNLDELRLSSCSHSIQVGLSEVKGMYGSRAHLPRAALHSKAHLTSP